MGQGSLPGVCHTPSLGRCPLPLLCNLCWSCQPEESKLSQLLLADLEIGFVDSYRLDSQQKQKCETVAFGSCQKGTTLNLEDRGLQVRFSYKELAWRCSAFIF